MLQVILSGANGRMGRVISRLCDAADDLSVAAGFDVNTEAAYDYPVYSDISEFTGRADVVIDFSNPAATMAVLDYCLAHTLPIVICTTGFSEEELSRIEAATAKIPVFRSGNMSLGINLILELLQKACKVLSDGYDVEIIERHHNQKIDAPSGTALMLADAVKEALPFETEYVYDRHSERQRRDKKEIGIHTVRGGTIVGEHEVIFAGLDEIIEIRHTILSREVFANGAVNAARFLATVKTPALYNMSDVIASK